MRRISHILGHLNMRFIVGGPVWIGLRGVAFSGRSVSLGTGFESLKTCSISIQLLFPVCSSGCDLSAIPVAMAGLPAMMMMDRVHLMVCPK